MRLSGLQRKEKKWERAVRRERKAARRYYLKRMRRKRRQKRRRAVLFLLAVAAIYLFALKLNGNRIFQVREEYAVSFCLPSAAEGKQETVRLIWRFSTGELLFVHETTEIHNTVP